MPTRLGAPVTRISASVMRLRSAVNSTPPVPFGRRARPTRSPGASRSNNDCALRSRVRLAPIAQAAFVDHEQQQAAGGGGFVRGVGRLRAASPRVVLVGVVEMNCTVSILRGWPLTSSSKSAGVSVGTGFASRSTTLTSTRTISALVSNVGLRDLWCWVRVLRLLKVPAVRQRARE